MKLVYVLFLTFSKAWASSINERIIGGSISALGQFPFAVALHHDDESSGRRFCGGSILNREWVLTAAQCIASAETVTLYIGNTLINDASTVLIENSDSYVIHPDYNPTTLGNNFGLIKLPMSLQFSDTIKPLDSLGSQTLSSYARVVALGWGHTSDNDTSYSEQLYHVALDTLPNYQCESDFGDQITETVVCAVGSSTESICHGDIGSPLIQVASNGTVALVGVASFYSEDLCRTMQPSVFQRTFEYLDWIQSITGEIGDDGQGEEDEDGTEGDGSGNEDGSGDEDGNGNGDGDGDGNGNGDGDGDGNGDGNGNGDGDGDGNDGEILLTNLILSTAAMLSLYLVK